MKRSTAQPRFLAFVRLLRASLVWAILMLLAAQAVQRSDAARARQYSKKDFHRLFGFLKGETQAGWRALVENNLAKAKESFHRAVERSALDTFAWEGLGAVALEENDYVALQRAWLEILERSDNALQQEAILRRLSLYRAYLPNPDGIADALQRFVQRGSLPLMSRILAAELLFDAYRSQLNIELAAQLAGELGFITTWDYIVGPFGVFGATDFDRAFEPEWDASPETFKNFSRTLQKQRVPAPGLTPGLDFESLLYPDSGVAYAASTFSVPAEHERAFVRFIARNPTKVWLNGTLMCSIDPRRESRSPECLYAVKLNPGPNQLFLKSLRSQSPWAFSVQILDFAGRGLAIRPADAASLDPTSTTLRRHTVPDISAAIPFRLKEIAAEEGNFFDHFYLSDISQGRAEYISALEEMERLEHLLPDSAFIKNRIGLLRLFSALTNPESSLRLVNQSREAFDAVLQMEKNNAMANLGKGIFHYLQQKPDRAFESFEKVLQLQPNDHVALYHLGRIALERGWRKEALDYLQRTRDLVPRNPEVLLTLASFYESSGEISRAARLVEEALAGGFVRGETVRRAAELAVRRGEYPRAVELYDRLLTAYPSQIELWWKKIDALIVQKKTQEAREAVQHAIKISPADPFGFQILAQLAVEDGHTSKAISFYDEALRRDPSNATTREKLSLFRQQKPFYEQFDASYAETLSGEHTTEKFPRSAVVWLVDVMVVDLHNDLSYQTMTHQAVKILNAEGREQWDEITLPVTTADVLLLRTVLPDGTQYEPVSVQHVEGRLVASMYGIAEGAIVDFAYRSNSGTGETPWQNYIYESFIFQQIRNPVALSRLVVIAPENIPFDFRHQPADFKPETRNLADGRIAHIWEKRNVQPIKYEPYQPPLEQLSPTVAYSTFPSWLTALQRLRPAFFGRPDVDAHLRAVVQDITQNAQTERDKLSAIYSYINTTIKPGTSGGTPLDTFYLKSGQNAEKLALARLMLSLVGINSHPCLYEEPPDVREMIDLPGSHWFRQAALAVPSLDGTPFAFRFESQFQPLRNLLETLERKPFLLLEDDHVYFRNLIYKENEESWRSNTIDATVKADGTADIRGRIRLYGQQNAALRQAFDDPNNRRLMLDQAPLQLFKNLRGTKAEAKNAESLDAPFTIEFSGTDEKMIERAGTTFRFLPCERTLNLSGLITGETRETPIQLKGSLVEQTDRIHFVLPEGYRIRELPEDYLSVSAFGTYSLILINRDTELDVIRTIDLKSLKVKESEFPALVRFCRGIDETEDKRIVLERVR